MLKTSIIKISCESSNIQSSNLEEGLTPFSLHQRDNGTDIPGILESRDGICFIKCRVQRSLFLKLTSGDKVGRWVVHFVARTIEKCQGVLVGFFKNSVFLENPTRVRH
ncbi:hypothetical protein P3S67_015318 [Capsicum chacoense]